MKGPTRSCQAKVLVTNTQRRLRVPVRRMRELVRFVARAEGRSIEEVEVAVVGRRRMATLNEKHLGRREVTDVLSFDLGTGPAGGICAQVVVCSDAAAAAGRRRGHAAWKELLLYVAHGLLHVLDYEDATPPGARRMHAREDDLLEAMGVGRVYGDG